MDLSIIIINWHSRAYLRKCLESIDRSGFDGSAEVIVVDNASFDGSGEMIASYFPGVKFIQSADNRGFSRANNLGFEYSSGRNILFLNPDTEIVGSALTEMVGVLDSNPDVAVLGCRLLNSDGSVQSSCVQSFPTVWNQMVDAELLRSVFPRANVWGTQALGEEKPLHREVETVSGACLLIRREVFDEVAGFSTAYFMYAEDADLCYRVKKAGWNVGCLSTTRVIHHGGGSSDGGMSSFSVVTMRQSICEFIRIHQGPLNAVLYRIGMGCTATARLLMLAVGVVFTFGARQRQVISGRFAKWLNILRWSLGCP
jgi:GT2 family glycosyltransferase